MARNTRATGSNNFLWEIGDNTIAAYVDSPILKEFYGTSRTQNNNITFAELINIGTFTNFGYLGDENSNFSAQYNRNLIDFIRSVDNHLKNLNDRVTAWENGNNGYISVTSVTINKSSLTLTPGATAALTATILPSNASNKNVTWSSSNTSIATVNQTTGLVTGIAIGTTTIIATSVDNSNKKATINVEVIESIPQPTGYYWYIGTENSSSISDIQTDNTVPGWHSIGSSLSGFVFDGNQYTVVLYTTNIKSYFYIIIPNELSIYDGLGNNLTTTSDFEEVTCNISGYKAYKSTYQVRIVSGNIIK